jgi:hypothetical protein
MSEIEWLAAYARSPEGRAKSAETMRRVTAEARANGTSYSGTHRMSHGRHPLYSTWCNMMARCYSLNYRQFKDYGGRGIAVCDRWHDPVLFVKDIEELIGLCPPGRSLDRINNNRGYEPGNVKWSTRAEQNQNSRLKCDAKLDAGRALEVKRRLAAGETGCSIAADLGVSTATISLIKNGKRSASVELPPAH